MQAVPHPVLQQSFPSPHPPNAAPNRENDPPVKHSSPQVPNRPGLGQTFLAVKIVLSTSYVVGTRNVFFLPLRYDALIIVNLSRNLDRVF